ncbi:MAG: DMT family transporter [Paludibacterium sp.]|uniref:DMT family transporter n=1 Tax=Paludibacterium sp. TaxID=1917523 RepID=UPI0025E2F7F4|nr:DMT family transporter [Paludibacterium sp.]MBV8049053.1 DMT family transporter [Paludibacterium sp.]
MKSNHSRWAALSLVIVTMIWGGTFIIVRTAVHTAGPLAFVGTRFAVAAVVAAAVNRRQLRGFSSLELGAGIAIGLCIFAGYSLQTLGLQYITSSKSAFITAFYVPTVPLLQWLFQRQQPHIAALAGAAISFVGLTCLAGPEGIQGGFGYGEMLTALGALAISAEIILIGHFAQRVNIARVTVTQLAVASLLSFAAMPVAGERLPGVAPLFFACALALGMASAAIQYVMNWAQRQVSATKATLIYAGEPVWAGLIGLLAGEHIPALAGLGAAMIILASLMGKLGKSKPANA